MIGHAFIESFDDGTQKQISPSERVRLQMNNVSAATLFRLSRCYFGTSRLALRAEVARKILPVPEALVFEADEYLFTMAAALGPFVLLPDALTHYRVHGGNLFLGAGASEAGERRKARVIAELAQALRVALPATCAPQDAVDAMLEIVEAEAAQLRLKLDGGWPWETFQTERTIYRVQHGDASARSKMFRTLSMLPALGASSALVLWRAAVAWRADLVQASAGGSGSSAGIRQGRYTKDGNAVATPTATREAKS